MARDYYEVLGVTRDASEQEIKRAYRQAAIRWHPDRNPDDSEAEERFKEAAEAYAVLGDRDKRARYDRFGAAGVGAAGGGGFDPEIFSEFQDIFGGFSVFEELFGAAFGGQPAQARVFARADFAAGELWDSPVPPVPPVPPDPPEGGDG